ncbi:MAG: hypothetical protein IKZ17_01370 [Bacteroidaceae bacterium]|nr:hypothetical protein [Bacteroidaceae bacterium]
MNMTISLTINATCSNCAENIAQRELMNLAKSIAMKCGAPMACGSGSATALSTGLYRVDATMDIPCNEGANDIIKDIQYKWLTVPEIANSTIFVEEPPQKNPLDGMECCECCGGYFDKDSVVRINPDTEDEYWLCESCFDEADDIIDCNCCNAPVNQEALVENPVTGKSNICPCCGETT